VNQHMLLLLLMALQDLLLLLITLQDLLLQRAVVLVSYDCVAATEDAATRHGRAAELLMLG